jgi:hypothetical protein
MNWIHTWGSNAEERAATFACDRHISAPNGVCFRAVDCSAPLHLTFSWLCQLRAAPYSYDWLDNYGKRSPRQRDPELERLAVGQTAMRVFRVVEFAPNDHLTMVVAKTQVFGAVAITYAVRPRDSGSRIVVKFLYRLPPRSAMRWILPAGDLFMMRKQLLTLKTLAEHEHATGCRTNEVATLA